MKEYIVLEWAFAYGLTVGKARRLTDAEKAGYAEWFKETGFIRLGEGIDLVIDRFHPYIEKILGGRKQDGSFLGCANAAWIISEEEQREIIAQNELLLAEKKAKEVAEQIARLKATIAACERQSGGLYTQEEAARKRKQYNDIHNDGGEGYVPHFYTIDEYNRAIAALKKLQQNQ